MTRALHAEYLKLATTKVWWALLVPVGVIAVVMGFAGAAIAGIDDAVEELGRTAPAVALSLPLSLEQTTVFAAVLGVIGGAGEFRHRTVTTTYLTAASRVTVLAAKAVVHAVAGVLYGLVTIVGCAIGAVLNSGAAAFPGVADVLIVGAAGCAVVALWTVLGVALGTLMSNQIGALVLVLVWLLFAEGLIGVILRLDQVGLGDVPPYLPGNAGSAVLTDHAISVFADAFGDDAFGMRDVLESLIGSTGQLSWLPGLVVLLVYVAAAGAAAYVVADRRDIT